MELSDDEWVYFFLLTHTYLISLVILHPTILLYALGLQWHSFLWSVMAVFFFKSALWMNLALTLSIHTEKISSVQSWIVIRIIDLNSPVQQNVWNTNFNPWISRPVGRVPNQRLETTAWKQSVATITQTQIGPPAPSLNVVLVVQAFFFFFLLESVHHLAGFQWIWGQIKAAYKDAAHGSARNELNLKGSRL